MTTMAVALDRNLFLAFIDDYLYGWCNASKGCLNAYTNLLSLKVLRLSMFPSYNVKLYPLKQTASSRFMNFANVMHV